jgi:hypothetical protein
MKKAFFVLLAIALVGVAAFADDAAAPAAAPAAPTTTAKFNVGVFTGAYYNGNSNTVTAGDSDSYGDAWSRVNFTGDFSQGDIGAKFTIREDQYITTASTLKLRRAFGYYNLLDGKVQIQAGRVGNGDFGTSWYGAAPFDNGQTGALVMVKPIEGLELGYLFNYDTSSSSSPASPMKFDDLIYRNSVFGVMYTFPNIATVQLAFAKFYTNPNNTWYAVGDINVTAIKDLTLSAEFEKNDGIFDYDEMGTTHVIEHAAYTVGKITPSIVGYQVLISDKAAAAVDGFTDTAFYVQPAVAYAFTDKISLGAELKYGNIENGYSDGTPVQTAEKSKGYATIDGYAKYDLGKGYIKVKPGYDGCDDHTYGGFFVATVFEASL